MPDTPPPPTRGGMNDSKRKEGRGYTGYPPNSFGKMRIHLKKKE
jgi:hypothetical protein